MKHQRTVLKKRLPKLTAMASAALMITLFVPGHVLYAAEQNITGPGAVLAESTMHNSVVSTVYGTPATEEQLVQHYQSVMEIFDAGYYASHNPDVVMVYGEDPLALYEHFTSFGLKEGRIGSILLDIAKYRAMNPDLDAAFGDNWDAYVAHYFSFGIPEGRWNGFSLKQEQKVENNTASEKEIRRLEDGSYTDDAGSIIIPWNNVVKFHYVTMEELEAKLGDSMVLLKDKDGNITFVGGTFTDAKVTDEAQAKEALRSMMKLMNFPEDTCELYLVKTHKDSLGNNYYRFSSKEKDSAEGQIDLYSKTDIIIGAGQDGTVLCMSTNNSENYTKNTVSENDVLEIDMEKFKALVAKMKDNNDSDHDNNLAWVEENPKYRYVSDSNMNGYRYFVVTHGKDGTVKEYYIVQENGQYGIVYELSYSYDETTYGTDAQMANDNLFNGEVMAQKATLYDVYGQKVELDVVKDEEGYHLCDLARNITVLVNMDEEGTGNLDSSILNRYTAGAPETFAELLDKRFVTALRSIQNTWDRYQTIGFWENRTIPILVSLNNASVMNANENDSQDAMIFNIYKNDIAVSRDIIAHEFTHGVLYAITGGIDYENDTGVIEEAFADVLGNLLEMMAYEEADRNDGTLGMVDLENWSIAESSDMYTKEHASDEGRSYEENSNIPREFANPEKYGSPRQVGGIGYIAPIEAYTSSEINDNGGVHDNSSILNHIAYRMHKELDISYQDLFSVWYDAIPLLTEDSKLSSIESYLTYSMKLHGLDGNTEGLHQFFEEAKLAGRENETIVWRTVEPAEGARLVQIVDGNQGDSTTSIPSDLYEMSVLLTDDYTGKSLSYDTEGANGVIVDDAQGILRVKFTTVQSENNGLTKTYSVTGYVDKDGEKKSELTVDLNDIADCILTGMNDSAEIDTEKRNFAEAAQIDLNKYRNVYLILHGKDFLDNSSIKLTRVSSETDPSDVRINIVPNRTGKYEYDLKDKGEVRFAQLREGIEYVIRAIYDGTESSRTWTVGEDEEQVVNIELSRNEDEEGKQRFNLKAEKVDKSSLKIYDPSENNGLTNTNSITGYVDEDGEKKSPESLNGAKRATQVSNSKNAMSRDDQKLMTTEEHDTGALAEDDTVAESNANNVEIAVQTNSEPEVVEITDEVTKKSGEENTMESAEENTMESAEENAMVSVEKSATESVEEG